MNTLIEYLGLPVDNISRRSLVAYVIGWVAIAVGVFAWPLIFSTVGFGWYTIGFAFLCIAYAGVFIEVVSKNHNRLFNPKSDEYKEVMTWREERHYQETIYNHERTIGKLENKIGILERDKQYLHDQITKLQTKDSTDVDHDK